MKVNDQFKESFSVSDKIYQGFIELFQDKNCLHTDSEYAKTKGFRDVVMHGNILNGFLSYFIGECLPVKNVIIHSQEVKYAKPVHLGDELTFVATVVDVIESVKVIIFQFYFENSQQIKVAKGKVQIGVI